MKSVGEVGCLFNLYFCLESSENLYGVKILKDMGYVVILNDLCTIVDRDTYVMVIQTSAIYGIYVTNIVAGVKTRAKSENECSDRMTMISNYFTKERGK